MFTFHEILTSTFMLLLTFWMATSQHELDYSDIESIGASCHPKDTCDRPRRLPFANRSCECDNKCNQFGDCCIDAPARLAVSTTDSNANVECLRMAFNRGVYVLAKCPSNYETNEVRSKCEGSQVDISDPLVASPLTDISTNITYKNHYCALCNDAPSQNLISWDIQIECYDRMPNNSAVDEKYVEDHITLVNSDGEDHWGFYYPEETSSLYAERQFYPCGVPFKLPDSLRRNVRLCRPELISSCAANWTRSVVANKCQSYTAVMYIASRLYKNPHCLMCNYLNVTGALCNIPSRILGRDKKPALSFTLLMDINGKGGNKVGEANDDRCSSTQQWDPLAKKCRTLTCAIPGSRMENGRCIPP